MTEFWETAFLDKRLMWGLAPTASAIFARDYFAQTGVEEGADVRPRSEARGRLVEIAIEIVHAAHARDTTPERDAPTISR